MSLMRAEDLRTWRWPRVALESHYGRDLLQLALCKPQVCVGRMVTQAEAALVLPVPVWVGLEHSVLLVSLASSQHVNVDLLEMPAYLCDACLSVCLFIHVTTGSWTLVCTS